MKLLKGPSFTLHVDGLDNIDGVMNQHAYTFTFTHSSLPLSVFCSGFGVRNLCLSVLFSLSRVIVRLRHPSHIVFVHSLAWSSYTLAEKVKINISFEKSSHLFSFLKIIWKIIYQNKIILKNPLLNYALQRFTLILFIDSSSLLHFRRRIISHLQPIDSTRLFAPLVIKQPLTLKS